MSGSTTIPSLPTAGSVSNSNAAIEQRLDEPTLRRAHRRIQRKALVIGGWYIGSYVLLLLAGSWWLGILACTSLAVSMAGVGFNVQHDANHNALFRTHGSKRMQHPQPGRRLVDVRPGWQRDAVDQGHVQTHHSATNVVGRDDDIELQPFGRLAPQQRRHPWHRFQHLYLWALYCFTAVAIIVADVIGMISQSIGSDRLGKRPTFGDYTVLLATKAAFVFAMVVVPLLLHPWWIVVLGIFLTLWHRRSAARGRVPARPRGGAGRVPYERGASGRLVDEWQVRSTVDFCHDGGPVSRLVTWYTGGLNYQTEHHLFPRVPHTAYPDILPVVRRVCAEFSVPHRVQPTLRRALGSHYRHLRHSDAA